MKSDKDKKVTIHVRSIVEKGNKKKIEKMIEDGWYKGGRFKDIYNGKFYIRLYRGKK
jgi:uncharacterized beta-barrel protein YwiB (DUF1934 family)